MLIFNEPFIKRHCLQSFRRSVVPSFRRSVVPSFRRSVVPSRLRLLVLSFCLGISSLMWGQYDYVMYNLEPEEFTFADNALKALSPNPNYVYILIHGSGSKFSIYNQKAKGFQFMSPIYLAQWLNADKITSHIILLSGANAKAAQMLADELGKADQLAKLPKLRHVINWEEEVVLYANGHIKGNGKCYRYEWGVSPIELTGTAIPFGNPYDNQASDFLVTNRNSGSNVLIEWLNEYEKAAVTEEEKAKINRLHRPASKLKLGQPVLYYALLARKECFEGWYHLKEFDYKDSDLLANLTFLCQVATISRQYTRNTEWGADMAIFNNAFRLYLKTCKYKTNTIEMLSEDGLSPSLFAERVTEANKSISLTDFFSTRKDITAILDKKWAIIGASEPNLAEQLSGKKPTKFPPSLLKILYDWVNAQPYPSDEDAKMITVDKYRAKLTEQINLKIGTGESLPKGLPITDLWELTDPNTGAIQKQQGSRGSIFETWVRDAWAKRNLFNKTQQNGGKLTFYFSGLKAPIAAPTATSYKRVIDCSYIEKNTSPEDIKANRCETVGVELKHTTGTLSGEPLQQFDDNVKLVKAGKLRRIEYIFSTLNAARANEAIFTLRKNGFRLSEQGDAFKVFCIDGSGTKTPVIFK